MVFVKANDAMLCRVLDALAKQQQQNSDTNKNTNTIATSSSSPPQQSISGDIIQPFIAASLHNAVEAIPPSQLQDALWLYLFIKRRHLNLLEVASRDMEEDDASAAETGEEATTGNDYDAHPTTDALCIGELALSTLVVASLAQPPPPEPTVTTLQTPFGPKAMAVRRGDDNPHSRLDALLRKKLEGATAAATHNAGNSTPPSPSSSVIDLALDAFSSPKRARALATAPTLSLLVRDLESLWALIFMSRRVRLRLQWQTAMLVGCEAGGRRAAVEAAKGSEAGNGERIAADEFFHDYDLLIPSHILHSVAAAAAAAAALDGGKKRSNNNGNGNSDEDSFLGLLLRCSPAKAAAAWARQSTLLHKAEQKERKERTDKEGKAAETPLPSVTSTIPPAAPARVSVLAPGAIPSDRTSSKEVAAAVLIPHPTPSVSLIINPATSSAVPNPGRQQKNYRVDVIEQAAMRFYYDRLTKVNGGGLSSSSSPLGGNISNNGNGNEYYSGPADDPAAMVAHLQAQLSGRAGDIPAVIDPRQMVRNSLDGDGMVSINSRMNSAVGGIADADGIVPSHRRLKSLRQLATEKASLAQFISESFIGLDIQLMALSGAAIGYYMGMLRGASKETCWTYAAAGLVVMMLVDAGLLIIRMGREDGITRKEKRRIEKQRAKLSVAGVAAAAKTGGGGGIGDRIAELVMGGHGGGGGAVAVEAEAEMANTAAEAETKKNQ